MIGKTVGPYRVLDKLGEGGMGVVFRARDSRLDRDVALKVLPAEALGDDSARRRLLHEARTASALNHPNICAIYDVGEADGQVYIAMELVHGRLLTADLGRDPSALPRVLRLGVQLADALEHAHDRGVVHRDLKPANLMITETGAVKIMDFGIARVAGTEHLTNAGFMMGTPAYMSPEQVKGQEIDARADLYAMGVVFYRLSTGKLPFKGDTPFAMAQSQVNDPPTPVGMIRSDLPPWVELVIVRALAKRPEERFQSAAEFHEAFARCLAGLPLTTVYGATAYGSTAQTEILATPPRPLPTGSLSMRGPGTGSVGMPSGPVPAPAPATTSAEAGVTGTPIAGTPIAGAPTATQPAAAAIAAAGATATPPAKPVHKKEKSAAALIVAAVAAMIVIGGIVGAIWYRSRQAAAPPPSEPVTEPTSAPSSPVTVPPPDPVPPPATPPDPAAATAGAPATPSAPGSTTGAKSASGPTPPPPSAGASGQPDPASGTPPGVKGVARGTTPATPLGTAGTAVTTPAGPVPPPAAPGPPETLVAFNNVKLYQVSGKRSNDRDVLLNFAGGQISVLPKDGGEAISTLPYRSITKATYVKARDPKWDTSLLAPPEGLDVGSVFRQSRHWLVLQLPDRFAILRLEDNNFARILETFEARTGLRLDRPQSNEK
jgi:serine/threonine-protein kinase